MVRHHVILRFAVTSTWVLVKVVPNLHLPVHHPFGSILSKLGTLGHLRISAQLTRLTTPWIFSSMKVFLIKGTILVSIHIFLLFPWFSFRHSFTLSCFSFMVVYYPVYHLHMVASAHSGLHVILLSYFV